jgi:hypothetical protein
VLENSTPKRTRVPIQQSNSAVAAFTLLPTGLLARSFTPVLGRASLLQRASACFPSGALRQTSEQLISITARDGWILLIGLRGYFLLQTLNWLSVREFDEVPVRVA